VAGLAQAVGQVSVSLEERVRGMAPVEVRGERRGGTHFTSRRVWTITRSRHSSVALQGGREEGEGERGGQKSRGK
jgi:hypothetical protein